ncbi:hypothetical protein F4775DRAFT_592021 [Biscogniauxia sp. FL1348]|nr:hypothetical protein F4775DRAFT_592021 [Biscogniauxia sp. FL1348]
MQFKLAALAAVLSAVPHSRAGQTGADVVQELNEITDAAQAAHLRAASINSHTVAEEAPEMVHHYYDMIELVNKDLYSMHAASGQSSSEPVELGGQAKICEAYRNFAVVNVHLLEKTIEKRQELRVAGYARQIAGIVNALYGGIGALSRDVLVLVPACRDGVRSDEKDLDLSLRRAMAFFYYR